MRTASLCAAAVCSLLAVLGAQSTPPRLLLAAQIGPGAIYPIGRFVGGEWLHSWPVPAEKPWPQKLIATQPVLPDMNRVPPEWLGGPLPWQWTLHRAAGDAVPISVERLQRGDGGCVQPLEVRYAAAGDSRDNLEGARLPINLAVAPAVPVEGFRRLRQDDGEYERVRQAVETAYHQREQRWFSQASPGWREEIRDASATSAPGLSLHWFYRPVADRAPLLYYFEGRRKFVAVKDPRDQHRPYGVRISGWLRAGPNGHLEPFSVEGGIYGADSAESNEDEVRLPRGAVRLDGRTFWIMSETGYESFGFLIYELGQSAALKLSVHHGGC